MEGFFILGVGGSAANASHAVNDFRKLCGIEAYAPSDNVSELTARTNDEGWETVFSEWLKISNINNKDALMILSVGGGNIDKNVSKNLILAVDLANKIGTKIFGIIGKDGGYVKKARHQYCKHSNYRRKSYNSLIRVFSRNCLALHC